MAKTIPTITAAAGAALLLAGCAAEPFPALSYAERPCYRTLAEVDCHARPLAGEESRRVGFYDEPTSVERNEAWPQRLF
ncbi:hypothetical protein AAFN88_18960 [Pelagibius sp. CAU 1746]|uniref:hypothetical protein n=1 Tax=Pelagibius sp. CAU 1746 TaxID=3140370 RepID=UPI00325B39E6